MCPRCSPTNPQLCYDLCDPAEFENMFIVALEKRKPQPCRSTVKPYEPSEDDRALCKWLNEWRWEMSDNLYSESFTRDFGCFTFMPNEVLNHICKTAHHDLIISIDTLAKETHWHLSKDHGQQVVDIVSEMCPAPAPSPLLATTTSKTKSREMTCTSCNQPGHSSEFLS